MHIPLFPLQKFLQTCPDVIHANAISHIANHLLSGQPSEKERLLELDGKRICLVITDTGNSWQFRIKGTRLVRDSSGEPWDVCIRGGLMDFMLLATRAEDPDSLFFARRLGIEGDTETGLYIKNFLDSFEMDWETHFSSKLGKRPVRLAADLLKTTGTDSLFRELTHRVRQSVLETAASSGETGKQDVPFHAGPGAGPGIVPGGS